MLKVESNRRSNFKCIYCLRTNQNGATPSISHILPEFMGSSLKLKNSVCKECNDKINKETEMPFKNEFGWLSMMLGVKGKRGNPPAVKAKIVLLNKTFDISLDKEGIPKHIPPISIKKGKGRDIIIISRTDEEVRNKKKQYARKHPNIQWHKYDKSIKPPRVEIRYSYNFLCSISARRLAAKIAFETWCSERDSSVVLNNCYDDVRNFILGQSVQQPVCKLFYHMKTMEQNLNIPFPMHAVMLAADISKYLGAIVVLFGLFYYIVLLNRNHTIISSWDSLITIDPQTQEITKPKLRGSSRPAWIPWNDIYCKKFNMQDILPNVIGYAENKLEKTLKSVKMGTEEAQKNDRVN